MLDDAMKTDHRLIGMVQPFEGPDDPPKLHKIGAAGRVTSLSETEDGRYLIVLTGIARFRIGSELDGFTPYRRVNAEWADFHDDLDGPEMLNDFDQDAFLSVLARYFEVANLSSDWEQMRDAEPEMLINSLSMMCPFPTEEKQALLEAPRLSDRAETLTALMQFAIAEGSRGGSVQ
jgi:Lon protease-like protein